MRLTLVRHGETPANVLGELDTAVPGPGLTDRGHSQAVALVDRFAGIEFDAIYASTHLRTHYTAAPLAAERGLQIQVRAGFREFDVGDLEGRSDREAIQIFVETFKAWIVGDIDQPMPGGESGRQVLDRFDEELARICRPGVAGGEHPDEGPDPSDDALAIFSHGGALRLWAATRANNVDTDFALANYLVNTGVIVLEGSLTVGWHCASWDLAPGQHA